MSEANKNNPNQHNFGRRRLVAGAAVLALIGGAVEAGHTIVEDNKLASQLTSPNALNKYAHNEIDPNKAVVIKVNDANNGTAWDVAVNIKKDNVDVRDLADEIAPQADAQGDPGVEPGETFVVNPEYVDPQKLAELQVDVDKQ